ncbi:MAG: hypothetical protein KDC87_20165 [Planctomycetes bacterium]|nr:hypothetical protein [Planctomycetota bacterium]MCB9870522.1 hypothetical protein [Planctomycetota bacterium]
MNDRTDETLREQVEERRLDWALAELEGLHRPPDLTHAILQRLEQSAPQGGPVGADSSDPSRMLPKIFVAAAGLAVVALIAWSTHRGSQAPDDSSVSLPPPVLVRTPEEILRLPSDTRNLAAMDCDDAELRALRRVSHLERLELRVRRDGGSGPTEDALANLASLPKLRELALTWQRKLGDVGVRHLGSLRILESLTLSGTEVDRDGVGALARQLPQLRSLEFRILPKLGDDSLRQLAKMHWLRRLSLDGCGGVTAEGLRALGSLRQLQELRLAELNPNRSNGPNPIDDTLLATLAKLTDLQKLEIPRARLSKRAVATLCTFPALRGLDLSGCKDIDDDAVRCLLEALPLQSLRLSGTSVTPSVIADLCRETTLTSLELRAEWMTPALHRQLRTLPRLGSLETGQD